MVSCDDNMHYVCVCQDQKYLLSLSKIPKTLRQQVTDYRLWHMSNFNCLPDDFECREKRAALPVITRYPNKLCSMVVGETVQKRVIAEHVRVRSLLEKVTAKDLDLFDNAIVTQLVETNLKGRKGLYAEYVFTFSCGSQRRLSAKDKMSKRVRDLVDEYEEWHLSTVGAYSTDWIIDQHEPAEPEEDDEDHHDDRAEDEKLDQLWGEDDLDSEPESLSDVLTRKQLAEDELCNRGLDNYDVIRHVDTWDAQLVKSFARTGDVSTLPTLSDNIRRLVGQHVLIYELIVDQKERLCSVGAGAASRGACVASGDRRLVFIVFVTVIL